MLRKILDYTPQKDELLANFQASLGTSMPDTLRKKKRLRWPLTWSPGWSWLPSSGSAYTITQHVPQLSLYKSVAHTKIPSHCSDSHFLFEETRSERLNNRLKVSKVVSDEAKSQLWAIWLYSNPPLYYTSAQHLAKAAVQKMSVNLLNVLMWWQIL